MQPALDVVKVMLDNYSRNGGTHPFVWLKPVTDRRSVKMRIADAVAAHVDTLNAQRYYPAVILSFACAETERVFRAELARRFPSDIQRSARRKLLALHAATELRQMAVPPGNRLEALKGDRKGRHRIRVNDQWRLCFRWRDGNAYDVEIVDYH